MRDWTTEVLGEVEKSAENEEERVVGPWGLWASGRGGPHVDRHTQQGDGRLQAAPCGGGGVISCKQRWRLGRNLKGSHRSVPTSGGPNHTGKAQEGRESHLTRAKWHLQKRKPTASNALQGQEDRAQLGGAHAHTVP